MHSISLDPHLKPALARANPLTRLPWNRHLSRELISSPPPQPQQCQKPTNANGCPPPPLPRIRHSTDGCRQNNALLSELSQKVTALRGVTVDIYDQARDHQVIDSSVRPSPPTTYDPQLLHEILTNGITNRMKSSRPSTRRSRILRVAYDSWHKAVARSRYCGFQR
jgi:hypothetical protein